MATKSTAASHLLLLSVAAAALAKADSSLDMTSFAVQTTVNHFEPNRSLQIHFDESYFFVQSRARIVFKSAGMSSWHSPQTTGGLLQDFGSFFLDSSRRLELLEADGTGEYLAMRSEDLLRLTGLELLHQLEIDQRHVVGPAKLLLVVDRNRNRLQQVASDEQFRNMPTEGFRLDLELAQVTLNVQFSEHLSGATLPVRI